MTVFDRPETPQYLIEACFWIFEERCFRCKIDRPLDVAHIENWPTCRERAGRPVAGFSPPADWHYGQALTEFHHIGNVLPLCKNCHGLYDGPQYPDVTEEEIRSYRDAAVKLPDVLGRLIDFVGIELYGRPNRCGHRDDETKKRQHSHVVDTVATRWPMIWIGDAYREGTLTGDPRMTVITADGSHHHVHFGQMSVGTCGACCVPCCAKESGDRGPVWRRPNDRTSTLMPS